MAIPGAQPSTSTSTLTSSLSSPPTPAALFSPTSRSSDLSSSPPRHHYRTSELVDAAQISPRELTWRCREEEGKGLQLGAGEAGSEGRSWSDDRGREGTPVPIPLPSSGSVRAVHSSTVRVERPDGSPPRSPKGGSGSLFRRRSLYGDPDSPD
ncbi:hypothetical protein JCM8097_003675 [Rhodosporidiobolus ruineniae]